MIKKAGIGLALVLVVIQFFPSEKNLSDDNTFAVSTMYELPAEVDQVLQGACKDCHSNRTDYPWYASIQPVGWWLNGHIDHGKGNLNFSEFTNMPLSVQNHKFEETIEMVEEGEMPLPSYTKFGLHPEANLTDEQRQLIIQWAKDQITYLKESYPADSLVRKPRSRPGN